MKTFLAWAIAAVLIALGVAAADDTERVAVKKPFGQHLDRGGPKGGGVPQILYNGGPLLLGTDQLARVPVYVIYYGNFGAPATAQTQNIVNDFLSGLSGTPQFGVNTTYCTASTTSCPGTGQSISGLLNFDTGHVYYDPGASQGTSINSGGVVKILQQAFQDTLPVVDGAIYVVVSAPSIKAQGFCTSFCAYHSSSKSVLSGHTIRYAFVPDPSQKCTACDGNFAVYGDGATPNGDPGADEMTDSIMHELSETVTDPDLNAWFTSSGAENGDLCNYTYGTVLTDKNGVHYNASWNNRNFLIQLIWKNELPPQACAAAP
jgi:hypothetical protein